MPPQLPQHVSTQAPDIIIACIIGPIVASIFVFIRVWTRTTITHNAGWDDYTALITLVASICFSIVLGISTQYGMGLHRSDMTPEIFEYHTEFIFISSVFYLISILGYRVVVLLMYLRLFGVNSRFRYATRVVLGFVIGYLSCNIITLLFGCTPVSKYWKPQQPGHCLNLVVADHAYGSMNVVSDALLFLLPLPMIWRLQLTRKEKLGLFFIFMSGIINCAVTTVRFTLLSINLQAVDTAWLDARTFLFSVVEINTGLMCGCMPILKPFFVHCFPRFFPNASRRLSSRQSNTEASSIWAGRDPDDKTRYNFRNYIELERGRDFDDVKGNTGGEFKVITTITAGKVSDDL